MSERHLPRLPTCWDDVEGAGLLLLAQGVGGPAEDGAVVQLVVGRVDQLRHRPVLAEPGLLKHGDAWRDGHLGHDVRIVPGCWRALRCC